MQNLYSTTMVIIQTKMLFWFQMTMIILVMMMILMSFEAEETAGWLQIARMFFHSRLTKANYYTSIHCITHHSPYNYTAISKPEFDIQWKCNGIGIAVLCMMHIGISMKYTLVLQSSAHWYYKKHLRCNKNQYCSRVQCSENMQSRASTSLRTSPLSPFCFFHILYPSLFLSETGPTSLFLWTDPLFQVFRILSLNQYCWQWGVCHLGPS